MKQSRIQGRGMNSLQLLLGTVISGIILAIVLEVIVQALPPYYSPFSQSESDLAVGPYGLLEAISFFVRGVLTFVFLVAFTRSIPKAAQSRAGIILLGASGIGKLIIAFVATDLTPRPETLHGAIHALVALAAFFCGALGQLLLALALRRDVAVRPSARVLVGLAGVSLAWSLLVIGTVAVSTQIGVWGLLERIYTVLFLGWILIVALGLWQRPALAGRARQASDLSQGVV